MKKNSLPIFSQSNLLKTVTGLCCKLMIATFLMVCGISNVMAEGSKDFRNFDGYRLFLDTRDQQQLKVFAKEGEFINVGASHVGILNGFIEVYRPDGTLHSRFDNDSTEVAVIYDDVQELAGPTGGGSLNGDGYKPGIIQVGAGEEGVWTVYMAFPNYTTGNFTNILNSAPWTRAVDQPNIPRVVLAWDITVSTNDAANNGGSMLVGRVFSNEYISIINQNGFTSSPSFYVLAKDGFIYNVDLKNIDPFRFPMFSNSTGFVNNEGQPTYNSQQRSAVTRSDDPSSWVPGQVYLYEPQTSDSDDGVFVNNKIFFNPPDPSMPAMAETTDIFRSKTYTGWLFNEPSELNVQLDGFELVAYDGSDLLCSPNALELGVGGYLKFNSTLAGTAVLELDLNNNGSFADPVDLELFKSIDVGSDSIYWNGIDGNGNAIPVGFDYTFNYRLTMRGGEIHILMSDIENNLGGVTFSLFNDVDADQTGFFYYDHSEVGGDVSGNGTPGNALPTTEPFVYQNNFGNNKILDYWTFVPLNGEAVGTYLVNILDNCSTPNVPDSDGDGINDIDDIDDDNDGVPDLREYCNPSGGFACLDSPLDPSHDEDGDGIPNYLDSQDTLFVNNCVDIDGNGVCDFVSAIYDTDGDRVPDHLDLDSDNDGITDLVEAGHMQPDVDGNGIIDGTPAEFGLNGLYNPIATDPDDLGAIETYVRWDWDSDGVPDYDDLDSDNDGINDVLEAGFGFSDSNNDGRIDDGFGNPPIVSKDGLPPVIDPKFTGVPIPYPFDKDGDSVPDWHDLDSDNDSIHDVEEGGNPDPDNDGFIGEGTPIVDVNGQATADPVGNNLSTTSRPPDTDSDNVPDFHDLDTDNDGINDVREASALDPDNDGLPGVDMPVVDLFGIPTTDMGGNPIDGTSLPDDTDNDGVRDYRDLDSDNDGINDVIEGGNPDPDGDGFIGTGIPNVNPDGQATDSGLDPTSFPTDTDGDGTPDFRELDSDNDGISDVVEGGNPDPDFDDIIGTGTPVVNQFGQATTDGTFDPLSPTSNPTDTDGDGIPDFQELDSDDDGILDPDECPDDAPCIDGDGDGIPDFQDPDRDNDGIPDYYECETSTPCPDTDGDGIPDVDDLDTDGDGLLDEFECPDGAPCPDSNNNGIPDWREYFCHPGIVLPAVATITGDGVYCEGSTVVLSGTNTVDIGGLVTYIWTGPNGFIATAQADWDANFEVTLDNVDESAAGTYTLQLLTEFGCPAEPQSVTITINDLPETPALSVVDDVLCVDELLELNSTIYTGNEVEYHWYFNNGTSNELIGTTDVPTFYVENVTNANEGIYSVEVQISGCASLTSNLQDIMVMEQVDYEATNSTDADNPACLGDMVELSVPVITDATYEWIGPMGFTSDLPNPVVEIQSVDYAGEYYAIISTEGCSFESSPTTIFVFNEIEASDDEFLIEFNQSVDNADLVVNDNLGGAKEWIVSILSDPQNGSVTVENGLVTYTPQANYFGTDEFIYEVCNKACPDICDQATARIFISGTDQSNDCFVPNVITPDGDGANDFLRIPCLEDTYRNNKITIFNRRGDEVFGAEPYTNNWDGTYRGEPLPPGTYFYLLWPEVDGQDCVSGYLTIAR